MAEGESESHNAKRLKLDDLMFAIEKCTEAINLSQDVSENLIRRAECHYELNDWSNVKIDCETAIKLDPQNYKAHYFLGLLFLQKQEYEEAVEELQEAMDAITLNDSSFKDIYENLGRAKYFKWKISSYKRLSELHSLRESFERAVSSPDTSCLTERDLDALRMLMEKAIEAEKPGEILAYLCCGVSNYLLDDPLTTRFGLTYDAMTIMDYIKKDKVDPILREDMYIYEVVKNLGMKDAVQEYLKTHGWAYRNNF